MWGAQYGVAIYHATVMVVNPYDIKAGVIWAGVVWPYEVGDTVGSADFDHC